jgi:hypothetical protein
LSELPLKNPAPADDTESEPRPKRARKPVGWSMITVGVLVAVFSIGAVALKAGGGTPQVIAYVIAWALFAFQRLILWEIPFMPARFVWFRAAVSLPFPFLAAAIAMAIGKP